MKTAIVKSYTEYCKITASPDGNCLYNSISLLLSGSQNKMKILKLITSFTIIKHKNFFDSIVQSDLHVDNCNFFIEEALKLQRSQFTCNRPAYATIVINFDGLCQIVTNADEC